MTDISSGWLSPQGEFFPIEEYKHIQKAIELGYDEESLIHGGWVKIFCHGSEYFGRHLTSVQLDFLENHGFDIECCKYLTY